VSLYSSLTVAALMGPEDSNKWATAYLMSFFTNFSLMNPLQNLIKINLVLFLSSHQGILKKLGFIFAGSILKVILNKLKI
jgi:hypothetical protein